MAIHKFIDKRIALIFISDLLVLHGVILLHQTPARMFAFYFLEFSTFVFSYAVYNLLADKRLSASSVLIATISMLFLMGTFIFAVIKAVSPFEINTVYDIVPLLEPWYELPFYLVSIISAHVLNVKKYLSFNNDLAKGAFSWLLLYNIYLLPFLVLGSFVAMEFNLDLKWNLVFSLIIIRNFIEYKRHRDIRAMEVVESKVKEFVPES